MVPIFISPVREPVKEPVILEPATVEALVKVPTEMLGVCTKPAAFEANEALIASVASSAHEEVPVRAPTKEPVNEPVKSVLATVPLFWKFKAVIVPLELIAADDVIGEAYSWVSPLWIDL